MLDKRVLCKQTLELYFLVIVIVIERNPGASISWTPCWEIKSNTRNLALFVSDNFSYLSGIGQFEELIMEVLFSDMGNKW